MTAGIIAQALLMRAAPLTLSQVLSATSTATTINFPGGILAGDLIVMLDRSLNASLPASVTPSGFTLILDTTNGSNTRNICSMKVATGSESGALTGMAGSILDKVMVVFRGSSPIATATAFDTAGDNAGVNNPTAQVVTASGGAAPLIVFGTYTGTTTGTAVDPRTFTPAKDGEANSSSFAYLAWKIYNSAPADVTIDMDDEGNLNVLQSFYITAS